MRWLKERCGSFSLQVVNLESQLTNLGLQINKTPMEEYKYKLGSQVIKRRWKKVSICHNWAVGSASLQMERVSSAKLRELRMIKRFSLKEQSQFAQIQLSVRKN